jgi:hypothetical protein
MVDDKALGSEDLKTVRYRIIFTKRNHETTLKEDEATVNYATDQGSLGGRYISDFWTAAGLGDEPKALKRLYDVSYRAAKHTQDPRKGHEITLAEAEAAVRPNNPVRVGWTIPDEDKKYIAFKADLLDQLPRQKGEYDRERNEELRKIQEEMGKLRKIIDDRL